MEENMTHVTINPQDDPLPDLSFSTIDLTILIQLIRPSLDLHFTDLNHQEVFEHTFSKFEDFSVHENLKTLFEVFPYP